MSSIIRNAKITGLLRNTSNRFLTLRVVRHEGIQAFSYRFQKNQTLEIIAEDFAAGRLEIDRLCRAGLLQIVRYPEIQERDPDHPFAPLPIVRDIAGENCDGNGFGGVEVKIRKAPDAGATFSDPASHINKTDGITDGRLYPVMPFTNAHVPAPISQGNPFRIPMVDWVQFTALAEGNVKPITDDTPYKEKTNAEVTSLDRGYFKIDFYRADGPTGQGNVLIYSEVLVLDGTANDQQSMPNGFIKVHNLHKKIVNAPLGPELTVEGKVDIEIDFTLLPTLQDYVKIIIYQEIPSQYYDAGIYSATHEVFYDTGDTPPLFSSLTITPSAPVYKWMSGIQWFGYNSVLNANQQFTGIFDQAYVWNPIELESPDLGISGIIEVPWNDPSISGISNPPVYNEIATLNYPLTVSNTACSTSATFKSRVRDPWGVSIDTVVSIPDILISGKTSLSSLSKEDFLNENYRIYPNDSNILPTTPNWDSTQNLTSYGANAGQHLQAIGYETSSCCGILARPHTDYTSYTPVGYDYTGLFNNGQTQWYYRDFKHVGVNHHGGVLNIELCSGSLTTLDLDNGLILVEVMLANTNTGNLTNWLTLNKEFILPAFNPLGSTPTELGVRTMVDEHGNTTTAPNFGFTISSVYFDRFTEATSGWQLRCRIGLPSGSTLKVKNVEMIGWN